MVFEAQVARIEDQQISKTVDQANNMSLCQTIKVNNVAFEVFEAGPEADPRAVRHEVFRLNDF